MPGETRYRKGSTDNHKRESSSLDHTATVDYFLLFFVFFTRLFYHPTCGLFENQIRHVKRRLTVLRYSVAASS